jgi:hypothetical protein
MSNGNANMVERALLCDLGIYNNFQRYIAALLLLRVYYPPWFYIYASAHNTQCLLSVIMNIADVCNTEQVFLTAIDDDGYMCCVYMLCI